MNLRQATDVLQVTTPFTKRSIRDSYRLLAKKHHPDLNKDKADSHEMMSLVNDAYNFMCEYIKISVSRVPRTATEVREDMVWMDEVGREFTGEARVRAAAFGRAAKLLEQYWRKVRWFYEHSYIARLAIERSMRSRNVDMSFVQGVAHHGMKKYMDVILLGLVLLEILVVNQSFALTMFVLNAQEHCQHLFTMLQQIH